MWGTFPGCPWSPPLLAAEALVLEAGHAGPGPQPQTHASLGSQECRLLARRISGLLRRASRGSAVRLGGWDPGVSGVSPLPAQKGLGVPPQSREPGSGARQVEGGAGEGQRPDSGWVFSRRGGWSVPSWAELPLPGPAPSARRLQPPFPSSSSLCTLAPGAGGRGGGWSFTFFRSSPSCRKQHQMTRAGSTAPGPEAVGDEAGEFPGRGGEETEEGRVDPTPVEVVSDKDGPPALCICVS